MQASEGVLLYKLNDHRSQRDKEDDADDAKKLSADHGGHKGVKRRKPHGLSHHAGIDELVLDKLHGKVDDEAAHRQHRIHQKHKEHADHAGDQCPHIGDDGTDGGEHPHQTAVGDPENRKCKGHEDTEDHGLTALSRQKVCKGLTEQPTEFQQPGGVAGLQIGAYQCAGVVAETLGPEGHIDGDDQGKRCSHHDVHGGRYRPDRIDQHGVDAVGDPVQQLLPVDALQPVHQPVHVGILCAEIGGPAGDIGLDLQIEAVKRLHKLRDQQGERQHQHKNNAEQGDEKAEKMDGAARGLLFGPAEQASQPLFQSGHRHAEKKRQNAAGQNGQDQIDKIGGKGQNGRKPQQCDKKRYSHNGHEQILFCFWFHDDIPFPEPVAANCKSFSADSFIVL